jgi:hypothetical protein
MDYPIRAGEPNLGFTDEGEHCLTTPEVNNLAKFFIDVDIYQKETEAIIDAVNGK